MSTAIVDCKWTCNLVINVVVRTSPRLWLIDGWSEGITYVTFLSENADGEANPAGSWGTYKVFGLAGTELTGVAMVSGAFTSIRIESSFHEVGGGQKMYRWGVSFAEPSTTITGNVGNCLLTAEVFAVAGKSVASIRCEFGYGKKMHEKIITLEHVKELNHHELSYPNQTSSDCVWVHHRYRHPTSELHCECVSQDENCRKTIGADGVHCPDAPICSLDPCTYKHRMPGAANCNQLKYCGWDGCEDCEYDYATDFCWTKTKPEELFSREGDTSFVNSVCVDDVSWRSTYGTCPSYHPGEVNHYFCSWDVGYDGRSASDACKDACFSCPDIEGPQKKPGPWEGAENCVSEGNWFWSACTDSDCDNDRVWFSYWGSCDTYEPGELNHPWCEIDVGFKDKRLAKEACPSACNQCGRRSPEPPADEQPPKEEQDNVRISYYELLNDKRFQLCEAFSGSSKCEDDRKDRRASVPLPQKEW